MIEFVDFINRLNFESEPAKSILICSILTIITLMSVIVIGYLIEKLEYAQINFLSKIFGIKIALFFTNYVTFVGTVIHEYSHALFAMLSGAKVTKIRCFEIFNKERLGSVEFYMTGGKIRQRIQLAFTSCAPVVMGLIIESILIKILMLNPDMHVGFKVLIWYFIISVGDHMSMSDVDIKNYCKGLVVLVPFTFVMFYLFRQLLY